MIQLKFDRTVLEIMLGVTLITFGLSGGMGDRLTDFSSSLAQQQSQKAVASSCGTTPDASD